MTRIITHSPEKPLLSIEPYPKLAPGAQCNDALLWHAAESSLPDSKYLQARM